MHTRPLGTRFGWLPRFAGQQLLACVFSLSLMAVFATSRTLTPPGLHRYDVILLLCLLIQWALYKAGWETKDELKVIAVFHLAGFCLEEFKTHHGCWAYPEAGWAKIAGVPLYSGFMYASVASYLCQAWRRFGLTLHGWPPSLRVGLLAGAIYLNFFSEHWLPDARWLLALLALRLFWRTRLGFTADGDQKSLLLPLFFGLTGLAVWLAENIATALGAWQYPNQAHGWHAVGTAKISSWSLLVIFSFLIVAQLKRVKEGREQSAENRVEPGQETADAPTGQSFGQAPALVGVVRRRVRLCGGDGRRLHPPPDGDAARLGLPAHLGGAGAGLERAEHPGGDAPARAI